MAENKKMESNRRLLKQAWRGCLLIIIGMLTACSVENLAEQDPPKEDRYITLQPKFVGIAQETPSRGLIDPNQIGKWEYNMGLFICDNSTKYPSSEYHPHSAGYHNMLGHCVVNKPYAMAETTYEWTFTPSNSTQAYSGAGIRVAGASLVDIYAYTPHTPGDCIPKAIPFTASQEDYMWAEPVIGVSSGNIVLSLKHAMTCFSFRIYTKKVGDAVLKQIKLTPKRGDFLVSSGIFDATTGEVNNVVYASGTNPLYIEINRRIAHISPNEATIDVIVPPITDYQDNDIEVSLIFYNHNEETELLTPISIPASSATNEGGKYQFKKGYRYIYQIEVDNYNKFTPLGFEEWSTGPDQTINIDI